MRIQPDCSCASPARGEPTIRFRTLPRRKTEACRSPAHRARSLVSWGVCVISFTAAALSRRRCTSRSRTSPSSSTARQSQNRRPAIITAISSRCHCVVGRGRRRSSRANNGPNFNTHRRAISYPAARTASFEKKLSGRGKLRRPHELELGRPDFLRPIRVHVTEPFHLLPNARSSELPLPSDASTILLVEQSGPILLMEQRDR